MSKWIKASLACFAFLLVSNVAQAGCRWEWNGINSRWVCDQSKDHFTFNVKNNCNRDVRVALTYYVAENGSGTWRDAGWYNFVPGEKAYLVPSTSRNIYLYAESTDGRLTWKGPECNIVIAGRRLCSTKIDMGSTYLDFTYNLNCN